MMTFTPLRPSTKGRRRSSGFTLIELLVSISVVIILASILVTVIGSARVRAKQAICVSNLRSIGKGFSLLLADNGGNFPGAGPGSGSSLAKSNTRWLHRVGAYMDFAEPTMLTQGDVIVPTLTNAYRYDVFHSPFTDPKDYRAGGARESFGVYGANELIVLNNGTSANAWGVNASEIRNPGRTILLGEHNAGINGRNEEAPFVRLNRAYPFPRNYAGIASNVMIQRKGGLSTSDTAEGPANILFADMHVETIELQDLSPWPDSSGASNRITFIP